MLTYSRSPYWRTKLNNSPRDFSSQRPRGASPPIARTGSSEQGSTINSPSTISAPGSQLICMSYSEARPIRFSSRTASSRGASSEVYIRLRHSEAAGSSWRTSARTRSRNFSASAA